MKWSWYLSDQVSSSPFKFQSLPGGSWVPSLSTYKITSRAPADAEFSSGQVLVLGKLSTSITPPRVEESVVGALAVRGSLALGKSARLASNELSRSSKDAEGRGGCEKEGSEGHHDDL